MKHLYPECAFDQLQNRWQSGMRCLQRVTILSFDDMNQILSRIRPENHQPIYIE
jgi:hypothetical protein